MDYVSEKAAAQAREFENRLKNLSVEAGILFVGVHAEPAEDGESGNFEIRLGIRRGVGTHDGSALVKFIFRKELADGIRFQVSTYQGVSGAAHGDEGDAKASTLSS